MAFFNLFGGGHDPAKEANKYLNQIPGTGHEYYDPFINQGREAGNTLKDQYGRMLNPTKFMDDIMKDYQMSQGATYKRDQLGRGIGNTAAAGGIAGTPEHQRQYGQMANDIMSQDMDTYLKNALGISERGLQGEEGFYNKGFEASGSLADMLSSLLGSQAGLAFQSTSQKNANNSALMSALMKALATGAGAYLGGPGGASAGAKTGAEIGSKIFG